MTHDILSKGLTILAIALLGASAAPAADELGQVSSVTGQATAQRPGEEPRDLACGDPVFADDTLRTGADSRVGVMLEDVMTHLSPNTRVALGRTSEAQPAARLEAGKVRMVDPRTSGPAARLAVLDADGAIAGNDAEAYIFAEKVGPYAMLCEWDAPLPVSRNDESVTAGPGECVISKPREPLYTAKAHDDRIPVDVAEICDLGPEIAALNDPHHHLSPRDVSAPPQVAGLGTAGLGGLNPAGVQHPGRSCADSASGSCVLPLPVDAIEPEPTSGGGAPGSSGNSL